MPQHNTMIPDVSAAAYDAARHRAAFVDRSDRGRIVVSGTDRASYLQGLLTNDIVALKAGQGCYAAYLTAQGRMIADLLRLRARRRHAADDDRRRQGRRDGEARSVHLLARTCSSATSPAPFAQIAVVGPTQPRVVAAIVGGVAEDGAARDARARQRARRRGRAARRSSRVSPTPASRDSTCYVERAQAGALKTRCVAAGVVELDEATAEAVRIEAGVPLFHRDMDEETIPLEAGIESRAISFTQGLLRRPGSDHPRAAPRPRPRRAQARRPGARRATGAPSAGAIVRSGDREIGHVTSSAMSPALEPADRARLRASRFRRAGHDACTVDGGRAHASPRCRSSPTLAEPLQPAVGGRLPAVASASRISSASAGGNSSVGRAPRAAPSASPGRAAAAARRAARTGRSAARPCDPDRRASSRRSRRRPARRRRAPRAARARGTPRAISPGVALAAGKFPVALEVHALLPPRDEKRGRRVR